MIIFIWSVILVMLIWMFGFKFNIFDDSDVSKRTVAITVDDLPATVGNLRDMQDITSKLLTVLTRNEIPVVGFVNEIRMHWAGNSYPYEKLLEKWVLAGFELGNHTYSHINPNDNPLEVVQEDILKGEVITRKLMEDAGKKFTYFRHPFLNHGPTPAYERQLDRFLEQNGYTVAPVTHSNSEWKYAALYERVLKKDDQLGMRTVVDAYVAYMDTMFAYWEDISVMATGYEAPQILLLHANKLNANSLQKLVNMMKRRGYEFVTLKTALKDKAYSLPKAHTPYGYSFFFRLLLNQGINIPKSPEEQQFINEMWAQVLEEERLARENGDSAQTQKEKDHSRGYE